MVGNAVDHHRLRSPAKHRFCCPRRIFWLRPLEQFSLIAPEGQIYIVVVGPELPFFFHIPVPGFFHRFDQGPGGCPFLIIFPHLQDHSGKKE